MTLYFFCVLILITFLIYIMESNENTPKAIILIIAGMSFVALQDTLIKFISSETNIFLILLFRAFLGFLLLLIFLKITNRNIIFKTKYPFLTLIRGVLFFVAFSLYFFSLTKLSLAVAVTLFFVSPFFITILSMIFLNEKIGFRRWVALFIGFIGVILVMDPKIHNFNIYTTFPIICAFFYSLTMIIQKITSEKDNLYSQVFHIYIFAFIIASIIGIVGGDGHYYDSSNPNLQFLLRAWSLNNVYIIYSLFLIGILGVFAFLCIFQAYRIGSPPSVAPFEYILIIWSLILSWMIWGETLNFKGFLGLFFIVLAGIYTFFRERKKHIQFIIDQPMR